MSQTVAHARKSPASCRIPCTLHNSGRFHGDPAGGRLAWRAACLRRLRLFIGVALLPLALFAFLPLVSSGAPEQNLGSKIEHKKDQIAWRKGRERVLSSDVAGYTRKINALQGDITVLQTKQVRLQADLDPSAPSSRASRRTCAASGCGSPACAPAWPRRASALSKRLVELYKADQPDLVTVVLESNGFADLLERTEFMQRVSHQDARIIDIVVQGQGGRDRDREAARQAREARAGRRRPDRGRGRRRSRPSRASSSTAAAATRTRARKVHAARLARATTATTLEGDLRALEAEQAKIRLARCRPPRSGGGGPRRPDPAGLGRADLAGQRPDRLAVRHALGPPARGRRHRRPGGHADPRRRSPGRVVLAGLDRRLRQLHLHPAHRRRCRRATATSRAIGTSDGASVSQGQVIGYVGCTGHCFGAHLHFETRINGVAGQPDGLPTLGAGPRDGRVGCAGGRSRVRSARAGRQPPPRGDMAARIAEHDWAATPLGPLDGWPQSLRTAVRILLTSRFAMWMAWGPELTFFYNDAYAADTLGAKHPWALGQPRATRSGRRSGRTSARASSRSWRPARHLGRGPAAVPRAQRLPRGDLPHVLLQPAVRRRRPHRRDALRRRRGDRAHDRRAAHGDAARPRRRSAAAATTRARAVRRDRPQPRATTRRTCRSRSPTCRRRRHARLADAPVTARDRARRSAGRAPSVLARRRRRRRRCERPARALPSRRLAGAAARRRWRSRSPTPGRRAPAGVLRRGPQPVPAARRGLPRASSSSSPVRSPSSLASVARARGRAPARRGAGRARPREDRLLLATSATSSARRSR